ncbi:MAG: hypothetical protein NT038_08465 [Euryarchaeota archaeon]|nr:hypothetical protein [Euryarchaeota archaeon]
MKRTILLGSLFVISLLLIIPSIPAVQYKTVMDTNTSKLIEGIKTLDFDVLEQKLKSINNPKIQEKLKSIDFSLLKQKIKSLGSSPIFNLQDLIIGILCITYMLLLGRPALLDIPYGILAFLHLSNVITGIITGSVAPSCPSTNAMVIFMILNTLGLLIYKTLPTKLIGLSLALFLYLTSYIITSTIIMTE